MILAETELQLEGAPWTPGRIPNWPWQAGVGNFHGEKDGDSLEIARGPEESNGYIQVGHAW